MGFPVLCREKIILIYQALVEVMPRRVFIGKKRLYPKKFPL